MGVVAILIVSVFLDNIDQEQASEFRGSREPFSRTFLATFRLLKDWRLLMLIPLTMYSGFEQSFLAGEYTKVRGAAAAVALMKGFTKNTHDRLFPELNSEHEVV